MNRIIGQTTGPFIDSLRKDKSQIASVSPLVIFRRLLDLGERVDPHSVTKQLKNFAKSCGKLRDFQMRWIDTSFTGEVITFDVGDIPVWIKLKIIREPMPDGKACINFVVVVNDDENGKLYTRLFGSMAVERDKDGNDVPTVRVISDMVTVEDIPVKHTTGKENLQPLKKEAEKPVEQKEPEKKEEPKPLKAVAPTGSVVFKKGDVIRFLDGDALCVTIQKLGPLADGEVASTTKFNLGDASLLNIVRFDIEYVTNRDVYDTDFSSDADRAANKIMDALDMWTPPAPEHAEEKAKPDAPKTNPDDGAPASEVTVNFKEGEIVTFTKVSDEKGDIAVRIENSDIGDPADPDFKLKFKSIEFVDPNFELDFKFGKYKVVNAIDNRTISSYEQLHELMENFMYIEEEVVKAEPAIPDIFDGDGQQPKPAEGSGEPAAEQQPDQPSEEQASETGEAPAPESTSEQPKEEEQPMETATAEQPAEQPAPVGEAVASTLCKDEHTDKWYMSALFGTSDPSIDVVLNKLAQLNEEDPSPEFKVSKSYPVERMVCYTDYTFSIIRMKNGAFYRMFVAHTDLDRGANAAWLYTSDEPDRWFMIGNVTDPEISRIVNRRRM